MLILYAVVIEKLSIDFSYFWECGGIFFHTKYQVLSSKNGYVIAVGTEENISGAAL